MTADSGGRREENLTPRSPIIILGIGNTLLSDEGAGVRVIEAMQQMVLPDNVELIDGGTGAFDLLTLIADRDKVIVIDSVKGGGEPGAVYRFNPEEVAAQKQLFTSVHQISLPDILEMARLTDCAPREVVVYGIEPETIAWGMELSPTVKAVIPRLINLVLGEL